MKLAAALTGRKQQDCLTQTCPGPETLRNPEPNFHVLGAKSFGRNSLFLLRLGFEQSARRVHADHGQRGLDLYKK